MENRRLARKISLAKWKNLEDLEASEIPADALTGDLRTTGNALSFWSVEAADRLDLESVVLALASASDRIDKMDLTWIEPGILRSEGIAVLASAGRTPVEGLRDRHFDVARLDSRRLGRVAELISDAIARSVHQRWTRKEVLHILARAVANRELDPSHLAETVEHEVRALLG